MPDFVSRNGPCPCGSGRKFKRCCGVVSSSRGPQERPFVNDVLFVATASRGWMAGEAHVAISSNMDAFPVIRFYVGREPVIPAHNALVAQMHDHVKRAPYRAKETWVLWCDDDAWWPRGTVARVIEALRHSDYDVVAGYFCQRLPLVPAQAFRDITNSNSAPKPGYDCQFGEVVPIDAAGMHFVVHRYGVLEKLGPEPFNKFSDEQDDAFAFFQRVREAGLKAGCDTGAIVAHIDYKDGAAYIPLEPAGRISNNSFMRVSEHAVPVVKHTEIREYDASPV